MVKKKGQKLPFVTSKARTIEPAPMLTQEQAALQGMFGSGRSWGTGENLPKLRGELRTGEGIVKSGDTYNETASMFGF